MSKKKKQDIKSSFIASNENIPEELKRIHDFLIEASKDNKNDEDIIIAVEAGVSKSFGVNHIYRLHGGGIHKIGNQVVTVSNRGQQSWLDSTGAAIAGATAHFMPTFFSGAFNPMLKAAEFKSKEKINLSHGDISELEKDMSELKLTIEDLNNSIKKLTKENTLIKELLYCNATSFGDIRKIQTIPIDIYLDTNDSNEIFEVYDSVLKFAKSLGFKDWVEFEAVKGSWFKRILAKSQEKFSSDELQDRFREVEYGIEVNTILKQQSEIDKNQSEALSNIITSLKDIPKAAIRIGALIVVKLTDKEGSVSLQTRTLSIKELHLLNKSPELLQMPDQILNALANVIDDKHSNQISEN